MRRIFFTLSLFICIYSHSQNKQALLKSDSLFAKGVELYNQKDYKAAIPLFTESDKIDKAELDSTSNRREYSAMWLGSCYYKLGEIQTAQKHYQYYKIYIVFIISTYSILRRNISYFRGNSFINKRIQP